MLAGAAGPLDICPADWLLGVNKVGRDVGAGTDTVEAEDCGVCGKVCLPCTDCVCGAILDALGCSALLLALLRSLLTCTAAVAVLNACTCASFHVADRPSATM